MAARSALSHAPSHTPRELATDKRWKDSKVAACSSTRYGEWARPLLKLFEAAPGVTMHKLMAYKEIYPGNKRRHFAKLKADSKVEYEDMIFFDDQTYNTREVSKLGVLCVHVPNGLTAAHWKVGIETFTKLKQAKADTGRTVGGYSIKSFDSKSTI